MVQTAFDPELAVYFVTVTDQQSKKKVLYDVSVPDSLTKPQIDEEKNESSQEVMGRILKVVVLNITTTEIRQDEQNFDFLFKVKEDATAITKKQKPAPPQKNIPTVKPLGSTIQSQNNPNPEIATKLEELSSEELIKMAKTFKA